MDVEFDARKANSNFRKHGAGFDEAASALYDPVALCREDPDAVGEARWALTGMSGQGRLLTVVYTVRGDVMRIVSARRSTTREKRFYAQGI